MYRPQQRSSAFALPPRGWQFHRATQFIQQLLHAPLGELLFQAAERAEPLFAVDYLAQANPVLGGRKIHLCPWLNAKSVPQLLRDRDLPFRCNERFHGVIVRIPGKNRKSYLSRIFTICDFKLSNSNDVSDYCSDHSKGYFEITAATARRHPLSRQQLENKQSLS